MDLDICTDKEAIDKLSPGDAVIIFTPDSTFYTPYSFIRLNSSTISDTHYAIALYAIEHGMHVLVTKPAVQLLGDHIKLVEAAKKHNVVCFVEHHKRFANPRVFPSAILKSLYPDLIPSTATLKRGQHPWVNSTSTAR